MLAQRAHHLSGWGVVALLLLLTLAACGTPAGSSGLGSNGGNGNTGSTAGGSNSALTPTPTHSQGGTQTGTSTTVTGCPNPTNVTAQPAVANAVLTSNGANAPKATIKKGEIVEVDLPFGHNWSGPAGNTQHLLEMQQPAGYASQAKHACVWRFLATASGTTEVNFTGRPICQKGQLCPMYIMDASFTITVQ